MSSKMLWALDGRIFQLLYGRDSRPITLAMIAFSLIGSGWTIFAFVPLLARPRTRRFGAWLIGTLAVTGIAVFALKLAVGRDRPFLVIRGMRALAVASPTDHSFPSGHAAGSFAFALFVTEVARARRLRRAKPIGATCIFLASCVGISRVVLGVHFPLDVIAGALLGSAFGTSGARMYVRRDPLLPPAGGDASEL